MTSMPASRSARAITLAPRSCPSSPGFAITTRILDSIRAQAYAEPAGYHPGRCGPASFSSPSSPCSWRPAAAPRTRSPTRAPTRQLHLQVPARLHRRASRRRRARSRTGRRSSRPTSEWTSRTCWSCPSTPSSGRTSRTSRTSSRPFVDATVRAIARASSLKVANSDREKLGPIDAYAYTLDGRRRQRLEDDPRLQGQGAVLPALQLGSPAAVPTAIQPACDQARKSFKLVS